MNIHRFTVGPFAENTYLLTEGDEALLVDPGFSDQEEYEQVKSKIQSEGVELKAVVLTHAHVDHVLGLSRVLQDFELPVFLSDEDRYLWKNFPSQAKMFGIDASSLSIEPESLKAQAGWTMGNFTFDVLFTPGHSPDHVSLFQEKEQVLIAGDVLFKEGIGRTDLYKGSFEMLETSILEHLYTLPDDTVVYPGHGPETTIGEEKMSNPFVKKL
ncbi:MAG TPA: MBL fold metallo-hydrolase [Balneolaceae bacterium]|nr:MBL fold metallo-hydrolase [Balneolaceae bacterium]